ncbi:MAG: hypothetical protein OEL69_03190 [Nitrosopumilus sp.]|nr:hypothetical protein [Nitrosopumilus sp.]
MTKTPSEKWKTEIAQYRKKCQNIHQISNDIRYVGVVNSYGRTMAGILKPNLKPLIKSEIMKNELFVISSLMTLRKETTSKVGKLDYVLMQHQKISVLIFQKGNVAYYVTINKTAKNINKIIASIKKMI